MIIKLKYFGPTNTKGSRIKAVNNQASGVYSWNYALEMNDNYLQAARLLWTETQQKNGLDHNSRLKNFKLYYLKGEMFVTIEDKE